MKFLTAVLVVALSPALANALPGFSNLDSKIKDLVGHKTSVADSSAPQSCTNFSGNWVGTCTDSQGTKPSKFNITQTSCDSLIFGTTLYFIGSLKTDATSTPTFAYSISYSYYWDATNTNLNMALSGFVKSLDTKSAPQTFTGEGSVSLNKNDVLTVTSTALGSTVACTYTKAK